MRKFILLFLLVVPAASMAQSQWWGWGCTPFEPSMDEIAEIVQSAKSFLSERAEFHEACFREEPAIRGFTKVEIAKSKYYWFFWPVENTYRGLSIAEHGRCSRSPFGRVNCYKESTTLVTRSPVETVYLYGVDSATELYDLLEFTDRFIENSYVISEIRQEPLLRQDPTKIDKRIYSLLGVVGTGESHRYTVERRCNQVRACTWSVSGGAVTILH